MMIIIQSLITIRWKIEIDKRKIKGRSIEDREEGKGRKGRGGEEGERRREEGEVTLATALARRVLPVPGGPKRRTPPHGFLIPVKKSAMWKGSIVASCINLFASPNEAILSNVTFGFLSNISLSINDDNCLSPKLLFR